MSQVNEPQKPLFSVIIPLYNKAPYIKRAIDSVLAQTIQDFEIIVVNDGSTDGGEDIVTEYSDSRIFLINQKNSGVSVARNNGVNIANGNSKLARENLRDIHSPELILERCSLYLMSFIPTNILDVFIRVYFYGKIGLRSKINTIV